MPSLADLQSSVARAMTTGVREPVVARLVGGANPGKRLDIHLRHFEQSLTAALRDKFAACAWLAGADLVSAAARAYVHAHPPRQPCIAEYGDDFPRFLANYGRAPTIPYLESFAELEWAVGQVSIAIDYPPLSWPELTRFGSARLVDSALSLQPGVRYLRSAWGVDELMTMYLRGTEPERFVLPESDTFIEVRGARGTVHLARIDGATCTFRAELAAGKSIGDAAGHALEYDSTFDPGAALRLLVQTGLATKTFLIAQESAS
ncbi:MAG TPA: DNA-binding domain-containing protein [Gammaproteobacteria bacterium]|nr:DNA-binding domain-containing protein [Gammaproteobacteria bacterium]